MDIKIKIDAQAALDLFDKVDSPALRQRMATAVADEDVLPALRKYPPQSHKKMQMTPRQRAAFFAKLRSGAISVPYQRTGRFGSSFQKQPTSDGVLLTSSLSYAPFVRGPGQAAYHRGNWDTLDELAEHLEADAALTATGVLVSELS